MIEYLIFAVLLIGILGFGAWLVEGPIGNWLRKRRYEETIDDGQTTSERGLGGGWKEL